MEIGIIVAVVLVIVVLFVLKSKKGKTEGDIAQTKSEEQSTPPKVKTVEVEKVYPKANYKTFDHSRIITELGLAEEDAKEFIDDLINQIENTIPQIKKAIDSTNIKELEELTHSIKGSATNLGSNGVASLLTDFNTYLKTGDDMDIIQRYFEHLEHYARELKSQYL